MKKKYTKHEGFTLIELLTVVAIIAALVAILSVAQRKVRIISRNLQQKAAFNGIKIGLELFSNDFDGYPESAVWGGLATPGGSRVTGSQHLAEAILGRDNHGFDTKSDWNPVDDDTDASNPKNPYTMNPESLARRKPEYAEFKLCGLYSIDEIWNTPSDPIGIAGSGIYASSGIPRGNPKWSPVITDVFKKRRIDNPTGTGTVKVGMPILYFKTHPSKRFRVNASNQALLNITDSDVGEYNKWQYSYYDCRPVVNLPVFPDSEYNRHYPDIDNDGVTEEKPQLFYESITQYAEPSRSFFKPYNPNTFILISAGYDGIYGTKDDLTNFDY